MASLQTFIAACVFLSSSIAEPLLCKKILAYSYMPTQRRWLGSDSARSSNSRKSLFCSAAHGDVVTNPAVSLRNEQLQLILERKATFPWLRASAAIEDHPLLKAMFLESPARWLRGERRLVQRIRASLHEWGNGDGGAAETLDDDPGHFDLGRRYALRGIAGNGAFAMVGWGVAAATGDELAFKSVPDVLPDRVAARRLMREARARTRALMPAAALARPIPIRGTCSD